MHLAAGNSDGSKALNYLVKKENVNQICNNADRSTSLHFAILANNLDAARVLLRHGAYVNCKDSMGNTPLHYAVAT